MKKQLLLFTFLLLSGTSFSQATANQPADMIQCSNPVFDLTSQNPVILGSQSASSYTVTFFLTMTDAEANTNPISSPASFTVASSTTIFVRVTNNSNGDYALTAFTANTSPTALQFDDVTACDAYSLMPLPPLSGYNTGPNGSGTPLLPGTMITSTQTIYIITIGGECDAESSFTVTINQTPFLDIIADVEICNAYTLPPLPFGNYFTGPDGTGTQLSAGDVINTTQTISVFAESNTTPNCISNQAFTVFIIQAPVISVEDVTSCTSYVLPALTVGDYYTQPGGSGVAVPVGTMITETTTLYVYEEAGFCSADESFTITIGSAGNFSLQSITICGNAGFGVFDLTGTLNGITTSFPEAVVTFHETLNDAQNGVNSIFTLPNYNNIAAYNQTIYVRIANEDGTCVSIAELGLIAMNCTENIISGNIRYDYDANGCTPIDFGAWNIQVKNVNNGVTTYAYTDANGDYMFSNVQQGTNTLTIQSGIIGSFDSTPASHTIDVAGTVGNFTADFCLLSTSPASNVMITIIPTSNAVPGFNANYSIMISNIGGMICSGSVTFEFDLSKLDYLGATPSPVSVTGNLVTFNFSDLLPYTNTYFYLNFTVKTPPTVNAGNILQFTAIVDTDQTDSDESNNESTYLQTVVNSFDPNDKTCLEGEYVTLTDVPQYLNYVIRFQNMGTAPAVNVVVTDDLDEKLDWSTFRPIGGSHDFTTTMSAEGQLTFSFENINLPHEGADEPGSHGYVVYQVKPRFDWDGTAILNSANIYFDFNEAIVTNTVSTSVQTLGVAESDFNEFFVYPNPADDQIVVSCKFGISQILIYDLQGKKIISQNGFTEQISLDVSSLESGLYFLRVLSNGEMLTKKLLVR